jgi:WD40-like Beta Propeller Repeat
MRKVTLASLLGCLLSALTALAVPAPAFAAWGNAWDGVAGAQLVSADYARLEQGDDTTDYAAISADGRYVAIQTRARNFFADDDPDPAGRFRAGGLFRFDLQTRALAKISDGNVFDEEDPEHPLVRLGAARPSISADGRYVAFATAEPLVAADTNENLDVYVRDMAIPIGEVGAFDLVSARDGSDLPAQYGASPFPLPGSEPGADVSRGVAISADGQKVVFRTEAVSDLPASAAVDVPAGQVFVRDRAANTTTLITAERDSGTGAMTQVPAGGAVGAALSADGTTVAWTGGNAASQTLFLNGENPSPSFLYYLWRRVADGASAPTRRITGIADPEDPACAVEAPFFDQGQLGPCFGPLTDQEGIRSGIFSQLPALSGDGWTVAFLTGAGPRPIPNTGPGLDLFVTEMTPGSTRKQATVELTRDPPTNDPSASPPLSSIAMAADGRHVAVTTVRTRLTLPALQLLGAPRAVPGVQELYVVDLEARTLERVAHSTVDGDIEGDVKEGPTISADGNRIAFTSFAGDLFFGDANQRADAFVATRGPDPGAQPSQGRLGAGGPAGTIQIDRGGPQIGVRARPRTGGKVELTVSVPAAGGIKAVAKAQAGSPRELRTLATATGRAAGTTRSTVRLLLQPVARYRGELRQRQSIPGRVLVAYVASRGGRRASTSLRVVFRQELSSRQRQRRGRK